MALDKTINLDVNTGDSKKDIDGVNSALGKTGGSAGGATIYANDSAITEISSADPGGLGAWHQDGATTDIKSGTIHYMSANIASTDAIKYSLYWRGGDFQINNSSTAPIIWTILEIA